MFVFLEFLRIVVFLFVLVCFLFLNGCCLGGEAGSWGFVYTVVIKCLCLMHRLSVEAG